MIVSPTVRKIAIPRQRIFLNYAINVQFLLCTYYLGHFRDSLTFIAASLDLPNANSIRHSYYRHSNDKSISIIKTANEMIDEVLDDEIIAQYYIDLGLIYTRETVFNFDGQIFSHLPRVGIQIAYDMGWQKKISGHRYDSPSGHSFFVGLLCNVVVLYIVLSKHCLICARSKKMGKEAKVHSCPMDYEGLGPKSIETDGALQKCMKIYKKYKGKVYVREFVSDNDSSTRSLLTNNSDDGKGAYLLILPAPHSYAT